MHFGEKRIRHLSKMVAEEILKRNSVTSTSGRISLGDMASLVSQVLEEDKETSEKIDALAREEVSRLRNIGPPGTGSYQAAFEQARRAIARRKGYPV